MPNIVIDDREIEVPAGTKVIDAARQLDIMIPRFCYHVALGSVGACRVCAVKFVEGPFKGVQMSCMIDAKDGMVVSTTDEEAVEFRKYVIECLMLHHPHDCPVCDEGGHCLLQDMTISGGHGIRRYLGSKRTYRDQYLGPLVQHEMNRCIHCYRCSRFYQEFAGYRDLGVMQSANRVFFGRYEDGILESPFTGNLSDICPTGVYTDKPSRFIGRRWDYERSPSLCINCSLGCHTVASARYRQLVRQEARYSEEVNGYFICDRGRYGFFYASHEKRPRRALVEGEEVAYHQAIDTVREKLAQISGSAGPEAIACLSSERSSLETQAMLKRVCQNKNWSGPLFFMEQSLAEKVKTATARLEPGLTVSLRELEQADFILAVGADPINEAPMLALAMRQAQRFGGRVVVIDPRPIFLPFDFQHLPVRLHEVDLYLSLMIKAAVDRETATELGPSAAEFYQTIPTLETAAVPLQEQIATLAQELRGCQRPVIVCGTEVVPQTTPALAADQVLLLKAMDKQTGLFYLMPGANTFGASLLSGDDGSFSTTLESIEKGKIKALIVTERDLFWKYQNKQRLERIIEKLDLLVVLDYVDSETAQKSDVFFPVSSLYEAGGVFINQEGRVQVAPKVYLGGTPIKQNSGGGHPPRVYGVGIPGSEPRPAWQVVVEIGNGELPPDEETAFATTRKWLAEGNPVFANLPPIDQFPDDGVRLGPALDVGSRFSLDWQTERHPKRNSDGLELILVDWTFGTEELSIYSPHLRQVEKEPCLSMHTSDAVRLGLSSGDKVAIRFDGGRVEASLCVAENMASGVIVMPRHRLLEWQKIKELPRIVRFEEIEKVSV
ncbi:MAG: NADH-quinone oxidoreductase subunit NuoG [Deltaproteobacteria bacterium]|nr:MAG: NADH-quinone oxidoreductase subunit NuoG [Deltaproteobacteria bacterium]